MILLLYLGLGCSDPDTGSGSRPTGDSGRPPADCTAHQQPPTGQVADIADHRYAWMEGPGDVDSLGYAVACSDELGAPLQRAWAAGAPEFFDESAGSAGWAFAVAGDATGEQQEDTARLVMRGDGREGDAVGTTVALAPGPTGSGAMFAGAWGSRRVVASGGAVWVAALSASPSWAMYEDLTAIFPGTEHQQGVIRALPLGDLDGDELEDFAVGHTYSFTGESYDGFISIHLGKDIEGETTVDEAIHTFDDDGHINLAGRSMWAGDVNDDGHVDLIHGEPDRYDFTLPGRVAIRLGPLLGGEREQDLVADVELLAPADDQLGVFGELGDVGDVNDDGVDDVVIADISVRVDGNDSAGAAYVFFGPMARGTSIVADDADLVIEGYVAWGQFGSPVIADHDGDGANDLVLANKLRGSECASRLHVFRGPLQTGRRSALEAELVYDNYDGPFGQLGHAMAACDLDGDGDDELVVGEPGYTSDDEVSRGRVQVIEGWDFGP